MRYGRDVWGVRRGTCEVVGREEEEWVEEKRRARRVRREEVVDLGRGEGRVVRERERRVKYISRALGSEGEDPWAAERRL